jgi:hypothetical protein
VVAVNGVVRLALRRPYTFVVMAVLISIMGVWSALRTPTDIFPDIRIPVVAVVFSYTGLSPDDMAGRIVTYCERALTTSVNNIEHIESQSIANYGIIKIYFQSTVNINGAGGAGGRRWKGVSEGREARPRLWRQRRSGGGPLGRGPRNRLSTGNAAGRDGGQDDPRCRAMTE